MKTRYVVPKVGMEVVQDSLCGGFGGRSRNRSLLVDEPVRSALSFLFFSFLFFLWRRTRGGGRVGPFP